VAEDHSLCDSNGSINVAQSLEFLLLAVADDVVLLDGVQSFLLTLQFNDVGVGNDPLCKVPHGVFKCGREQQHLSNPVPLDTNALVLMALCGDHDISFIQDEHLDPLGLDEFKLLAPIQNCTGSANHDLYPSVINTSLSFDSDLNHSKSESQENMQ
uniref:Uncharacterized protein n=1 Tax=Cyprinus carpio TaxID=7962 RepID=A0A8C1NQ08_CYPCA